MAQPQGGLMKYLEWTQLVSLFIIVASYSNKGISSYCITGNIDASYIAIITYYSIEFIKKINEWYL